MRGWLQRALGKEGRGAAFPRLSSPRPTLPKDTPLDRLRYVVLDTEWTSLDSRSNRLLSMGAIGMQGPSIRLNQQLYRVVNPGVAVPGPGVLIHRLRPCDVEQGSPPLQVLEELNAFAQGAAIVGHFIGMDLKVLRKELAGAGSVFDHPAIDTARVHRWILWRRPHSADIAQQLENLDLQSLAKAYKLEFQEAHHALEDAYLTARLWQRMIHTLQAMKIRDLGALLKI
jgi:DNA polymerase-3 subunit epsilon